MIVHCGVYRRKTGSNWQRNDVNPVFSIATKQRFTVLCYLIMLPVIFLTYVNVVLRLKSEKHATEQCNSKQNRVMRKNTDFFQFLVMKGKGL